MASLMGPWFAASVQMDVAALPLLGEATLAARREERWRALLQAAQASRFYQPLLAGKDLATLRPQDLPVVHKAELMARFADWVTDPAIELDGLRRFLSDRTQIGQLYLGRYVVWESSGSSGVPGIFVQDAAAMATYDALESLRRPTLRPLQRLLDPFCLGERMAFVGATEGHFASTVSVERLRRVNPFMASRLHGVSFMQPVGQLVAELQALAPTILSTYPSAAVMLAGEQRAGRLNLSLQEIWTGGEPMTAAMRQYVSEAFGCPLANSYGASEFLSLAFECSHGQLHLNSDWAILESVDDKGQPVEPGEAGATVLLSNLANHVQPLIRYDLGDRVTLLKARCACGAILPGMDVAGRSDDALLLGPPGAAAVCVLPLAITTVLDDEVGLCDFQLVQQGPQDLLLRTGLRGDVGAETARRARQALASFLTGLGAQGVRIHHQSGAPVHTGPSGKQPRVIAWRP